MKKTIHVFLSMAVLLCITACQKTKDSINEATEFNIDYSTTVSIPSTSITVTAPAEFTSPEIPTTSSSKFASEKTSQDLIDEIVMTNFNITNPNGNLDFLKSISIYIKASGVADILVASKSNIPPGTKTVAADLTKTNIKNHIFKDKIQFRVSVSITTGLSSDQTVKIDQTVTVKGKKVN